MPAQPDTESQPSTDPETQGPSPCASEWDPWGRHRDAWHLGASPGPRIHGGACPCGERPQEKRKRCDHHQGQHSGYRAAGAPDRCAWLAQVCWCNLKVTALRGTGPVQVSTVPDLPSDSPPAPAVPTFLSALRTAEFMALPESAWGPRRAVPWLGAV